MMLRSLIFLLLLYINTHIIAGIITHGDHPSRAPIKVKNFSDKQFKYCMNV